MKNVTIYSTPTCHFCHVAKDFFNSHSIPFTDYDVTTDLKRREEMFEKSGQMGVPVIFIDDQMVVGFDQAKISQILELN